MNIPRLVVAGTSSGVGKTTITTGLVAAIRGRGLRVQPFKCGPDYIDPGYLALAAGLPCHNLDSWMLPAESLLEIFAHANEESGLAVVEGVMGLYDGQMAPGSAGSTAEVAKILGAPVILVIDVARMSESAAAVALGYRHLDPELNIAGVILNRVGSARHLQSAREAVEKKAGIPVLGYLSRESKVSLPERHLGLVPAAEKEQLAEYIDAIREKIEATVDVLRIVEIARANAPMAAPRNLRLFPRPRKQVCVHIAVARDEAFNFYYQMNLDLLAAWGAGIKYFSPLHDTTLPSGIGGIYIGGGFPEIHAAQLENNIEMKQALLKAADKGIPIYVECGGLMYASQGIVTFDGDRHAMVGLLPGWAEMQGKRVRMGYAEAETLRDSILSGRGKKLRGHLFHWSKMPEPGDRAAYRILTPVEQLEGLVGGPRDNILGSYFHLHFGAEPSLAKRFVESCAVWTKSSIS
ncbi:MAG: cobyrinate a,c-diamide synthase [Chloroflexota bacterium]|nr:cobyrinate a,c-diamide synthase [Chloroflexota bacterium]